jgi:hypothetical protein
LFAGERMLTPPKLRAGRLKATIYNPNDNTNWLLEATFIDGNMASNSIYNLNKDAKLDEDDRVNANANLTDDGDPDYNDPEDIPMSWQRPDGNMSQPTIASLGAGVDTMFLNFLNPPIVEAAVVPGGCTGDCEGGLEGGHIDLDHDSPADGFGGGTAKHTHQYDDTTHSTIIDYLDTLGQDNVNVVVNANAGVDDDTTFIPLIANADFSKGATLIISRNNGAKDLIYNVVDYQKMIHEALAAWDGISTLKDPSGMPLEFKMNQIDEFKMSFNSLALISGGLHPSVTGCVKGNDYPESGRWRNGALTMHLVKVSQFADLTIETIDGEEVQTESALDRVTVQTPIDFQEAVYLNGIGVALTKDVNNDSVINALSTDYEIYGGLISKDNDGFLFESTMFWHYGGACYGESSWAADYLEESQYTVVEILYEQLDRAGVTTLDELSALIDGLIDSGCATVGGGDSGKKKKDAVVDPDSCQDTYDELQETLALGLLLEESGTIVNCGSEGCLGDGSDEGTDEGSGTSLSGDPESIIGGIDESGITSGPNFASGRRTWIDIMAE